MIRDKRPAEESGAFTTVMEEDGELKPMLDQFRFELQTGPLAERAGLRRILYSCFMAGVPRGRSRQ